MPHVPVRLVASAFLICILSMPAAGQNLASRLGYANDAILLIVHADDFGMCHSENRATIDGLERGIVTSASIMMPCAWAPEATAYARAHPLADIGLHLTLTNEWSTYKWGPLLGAMAPSLAAEDGYMHSSVAAFVAAAKLSEVEAELRAQIDRALAAGVDVTHLDTHMRAGVATPELLRLYIRLGRDYRVPVMLDGPRFTEHYGVTKEEFVTDDDVLIDGILDARPAHFDSGMQQYYIDLLTNLQSGVYCLLVHVGIDDAEMRAVTHGHHYWHHQWRQQDLDFVLSEETKSLIEDRNIQLITWREIRDKLVR